MIYAAPIHMIIKTDRQANANYQKTSNIWFNNDQIIGYESTHRLINQDSMQQKPMN